MRQFLLPLKIIVNNNNRELFLSFRVSLFLDCYEVGGGGGKNNVVSGGDEGIRKGITQGASFHHRKYPYGRVSTNKLYQSLI